jgi:membrane protease YdiL (CAAX protease family)
MATWLEYAARGRNAPWRYVVALPLALLLAITLGVLLVMAVLLLRLAPMGALAQVNDPSQPIPFFLGVFASFGLLLAGFALALRVVHRKHFGDLLGRWRWRWFGVGLVGWSAAQIVATAADAALAPQALRLSASSATLTLALVAIPALAVQTFTEEFVFRGYATQGLLLGLRRPLVASILSGVIFAAVHIPNGAPQAASALLFGSVISYAAIRTGSLAFGFGVHLANNVFGGVVVTSDADVFRGAAGLITEHAPGLLWWDVGVEAVILAVMVVLLVRLVPGRPASIAAASPRREDLAAY